MLSISDLKDEEILDICQSSLAAPVSAKAFDPAAPAVGLLFTEPSTRTRVSFERAAQRLGRPTILVDAKSSSLEKGETLVDTILNLQALDVRTFVIRTSETGSLEALRSVPGVSVVNAGDGVGEHPTQALLDFATLLHARGGDPRRLRGLRLGILGDLKRSRVARSWNRLAQRFGIELVLVSPADWQPDWLGRHVWTDDKRSALSTVDVLMVLRIQKERMYSDDKAASSDFVRRFHVQPSDLAPHQLLMHPGPVNWGIELSEGFKTDPRSLILKQVEAGLTVRAAVLERLSR